MSDLFEQKAKDWDERPFPAQISEGVGRALQQAVPWRKDMQVLDFGAGTGLICAHVAPRVARVFAVDISRAMLDKLAEKTEIRSKVEIISQDSGSRRSRPRRRQFPPAADRRRISSRLRSGSVTSHARAVWFLVHRIPYRTGAAT